MEVVGLDGCDSPCGFFPETGNGLTTTFINDQILACTPERSCFSFEAKNGVWLPASQGLNYKTTTLRAPMWQADGWSRAETKMDLEKLA
jgi:hypothetical protein